MTINNAITRLRALAARAAGPERRELLELADGLEAAVGVLERGARDIASGRLPACANCRTAAGGGLTCPACGRWFCDNCYDTGLGDGCHCHGAGAADLSADWREHDGKHAQELGD